MRALAGMLAISALLAVSSAQAQDWTDAERQMMLDALIAHQATSSGPFLPSVIARVRTGNIGQMDLVAINGALMVSGKPDYVELAFKVQKAMGIK